MRATCSRYACGSGSRAAGAGRADAVRSPTAALFLQVLLLSDELRVDEMTALMCLVAAHDARGDASAAAAAGVFFDGRAAALASLRALLQSQLFSAGDAAPDVATAVRDFVGDLLAARSPDGRSTLLARLTTLATDASLDPEPGAALARVVDERGAEADRRALVAAERAAVCECLALAARAAPSRAAAADVAALVDAAHALSLRARTTDAALAPAAWSAAATVALAAGAALAPRAGPDAAGASDANALAALAADAPLASRLDAPPPAGDRLAPLLRLAWGALLSTHGPASARDRAADAITVALDAGACGTLASLLGGPALGDEPPATRRVAAAAAHDVLASFLDSDAGRDAVGDLATRSADAAAAAAASGGALTVAAPPPPPFSGMHRPGDAAPPPPSDALDAPLAAIGAVLDAAPELWLDPGLRAATLADFLEYVGGHPVLAEAPPTLVAYLRVLASVARGGRGGAAAVLNQLRAAHAPGTVSWRAGLGAMAEYCARYAGPAGAAEAAAAAAAGGYGGYGFGGAAPPPPPPPAAELAVPDSDAAGMAAYADLAAAVLAAAPRRAAASWRSTLEAEAGGAPLAELALQLMCHPVPSSLKASLDGLLTALAGEPGAAGPLLDRLGACLLAGGGATGALAATPHGAPSSSLARYDAAYQLAEVEARREEYGETLALVRLLTACVTRAAASAGGLAAAGASHAHLALFVRRDVLGAVVGRGFRDPAQRWALAAAAFDHVSAWLADAVRARAAPGGPFAGARSPAPGARPPPALDAVLDLLSEGDAARAALAVLLPGADALAAEPRARGAGAARESAVAAALRLLRLAASLDGAALDAVRAAGGKGAYEPLAAALSRDVRVLPALLDHARYSPSPKLQAEAMRLAVALAPRLPRAADALLQAGAGGAPGAPSPAARVRDGVAACLAAGLFGGGGSDEIDWGSDEGGDSDGDDDDFAAPPPRRRARDPRAALALELLAGGAASASPSLAHLLIGYDVSRGEAGLTASTLDARFGGAAACPLVRASLTPAHLDADTDACVLAVLADLAGAPAAGGPARALLRAARVLPLRLADEADAARGGVGAPRPRAAALLLRAASEELLRADAADPAAAAGVADLAAALLDRGGGRGGDLAAAALLAAAAPANGGPPPPAPHGSRAPPPAVAAAAAALGVDALLASPDVRTSTGSGADGVPAFDVGALAAALAARCADADADARRGGPAAPPPSAARAACRAALEFAAAHNDWAADAAARGDAAAAWAAAVGLLFARRFDAVAATPAASGADGGGRLALELARAALSGVRACLPGDAARAAAPLARAATALLARAREVGARSLGAPGDAPAAVRAPAALAGVLEDLLAALAAARGAAAPRSALHGALVEFLGLAAPPAASRAPPSVLAALVAAAPAGRGGEGESAVDAGVAAALAAAPGLVEAAAADALEAGARAAPSRVTALAALAALAALPGGDVAARVRASGLPARLAGALAAAPATAFVAPAMADGGAGTLAGRAAALEAEAALALLARCARAGGASTAPAAAAAEVSALARCAALDLEPEDAGAGGPPRAGGARAALARVLPAALRLVSLRLSTHPGSPDVVDAVSSFVTSHRRALVRVLVEAGSPGARGWVPGPAELGQASLALGLLARLAACSHASPSLGDAGAELRDAGTRLAAALFAVDVRGALPAPARLAAARDAGGVPPDDVDALRALEAAVRRVRVEAAAYVLALVRGGGGGGGGGASSAPLLLRAAPPPGAAPGRLSLLSVKDCLFQAAEDLYAAADARRAALAALAAPPSPTADRGAALAAAVAADGAVRHLLRLAETCMAIVFCALRARGGGAGGDADRAALGRVLASALDHLARLPPDGAGGEGRAAALAALARRVEGELMAA